MGLFSRLIELANPFDEESKRKRQDEVPGLFTRLRQVAGEGAKIAGRQAQRELDRNPGAKFIRDVAVSSARAAPRFGANIGVSTGLYDEFEPESGVGKLIYGTEPLRGVTEYGRETVSGLGGLAGRPELGKNLPAGAALPLGILLGVADVSLGGSGRKQVIKALAKTDDVAEASKLLKALGVADEAIPDVASRVSKTSSTDEIARLLSASGAKNQTAKALDIVPPQSSVIVKQPTKDFSFTSYAGGPSDTISSFAKTVDGNYESQGAGIATQTVDRLYGRLADRNQQVSSLADSLNESIGRSRRWKIKNGVRVGEALETIPDNRILAEDSSALAKEFGFTPDQVDVAKSVRQHYVETLAEVNRARVSRGQTPIPQRKNYMTHLTELIDDSRGIGDDLLIPDEKFNPSAMARTADSPDFEKNVFKTLDIYNRRVANEVHLTPAIKEMKDLAQELATDGNIRGAEFVERYIQEGLLGQTPAIDKAIGLFKGNKGYNIVQRINMARSLGGIVGNLRFLTITQPASIAQTVGKAGPANFLKGAFNYLASPSIRNDLKDLNVVRLKKSQNIGTTAGGQLDFQKGMVLKSKLQSYNDIIGAASNFLERHITGISAAAGRSRAKQLGLKGKDADIFAGHIAEVTQSMYNPETRAQLLNNISVRSGIPFQTFSFEMYRHMKNIAGKGTGGMPLKVSQRLAQGTSMVVATMLYNYMAEKATGNPVTTPGSVVPIAGPLIDRTLGFTSPDRPTLAPEQDIEKIVQGIGDYAKYGDETKLRQSLLFWGAGLAGIGGAAQMNRIIDGWLAVEAGESRTPSGKKRFDVGPDELFKATLLGPYGTREGKEYIQNLPRQSSNIFADTLNGSPKGGGGSYSRGR